MSERQGLVLGVYEAEGENADVSLTKAAQGFQADKAANLANLIQVSGLSGKQGGKCRVFYNLDSTFSSVAVVKLGKKDVGYNEAEEIEEGRENVRAAVAVGVKQLNDQGIKQVTVDPCGDPEAAAEGAHLCVWNYDDLKKEKKPAPEFTVLKQFADSPDSVEAAWKRGKILAEGQNFSRSLMEAPANIMTPTRFAEIATSKVGAVDKVEVRIREREWAEEKKMNCYLGVSRGSDEPPKFVEVEYRGGASDAPPLAVVGKGITFDSGGISIKPSAAMDEMRADMGGAACTLASVYTAARLQLPINIIALMPCCENMPGGRATKPGDVHTSMSGKTVQIDNTDAEGRLILCDALHYAETFKPRGIIDMATLTGAMVVALGSATSGAFTNSSLFWQTMHQVYNRARPGAIGVALGSAAFGGYTNSSMFWKTMHEAGQRTGDRVWRMPLYKHYTSRMTKSKLADLLNTAGRPGGACNAAAFLKAGGRTGDRVWRMPVFKHYTKLMTDCGNADVNNIGKALRAGGSCTAAAFLKEFVTNEHWMHLDIAGVMKAGSDTPYLPPGMSGRPTRTLVEFINSLSKAS